MYVIVTRRDRLSFRGRVADLRDWLKEQRELWPVLGPTRGPTMGQALEAWMAGRAPVIKWRG